MSSKILEEELKHSVTALLKLINIANEEIINTKASDIFGGKVSYYQLRAVEDELTDLQNSLNKEV